VRLIAHRGYAARYPENSLVAIEAALAVGARFIEIDIQLSREHEAVLFHDETLERLCTVEGTIADFDLAELRRLELHPPHLPVERVAPFATLAEVVALLRHHPGVTLFVEIKSCAVERFGVETVCTTVLATLAPIAARCAVIAYSETVLRWLRQSGRVRLGLIHDDYQRGRERAAALGVDLLFTSLAGLPAEGGVAIAGVALAVYEVGDAATARVLQGRGVDFCESFAIGELIEALDRKGGWG
jgi:glycerophosphoryl diester phosphodiesterase